MIAKPHKKKKYRKIRLILMILMCFAALLLFLHTIKIDISAHRIKIASLISKSIGREIHIDGEIGLKASLRPYFIAENIRMPNSKWSSPSDFVKVHRFEVQIALLPLIKKKIRILKMNLVGMNIHMEYDSEGKPNWQVEKQKMEMSSKRYLIDALPINIQDSKIVWHLKGRSPIVLSVNILETILEINKPIKIEGITTINDVPLEFILNGGPLDQLRSQKTPWPFQGSVFINDQPIEFKGTILDPIPLKGIRLQLSADYNALTSMLSIDYHRKDIGRLHVNIDLDKHAFGYHISISSNVSNLDLAVLNIDLRFSDEKKITGTANATVKHMERVGVLFDSELVPMGPVRATGNFILRDNLLKIESLKGYFAGSTLQGNISVALFEPFKTSLNLQTKTFDVGNILALRKPNNTLSIRANDVKLSANSRGKTMLKSILGMSWMLKSSTGQIRWRSPSKANHYEIGISKIRFTSELNQSIDIGLNANYNELEFKLTGRLGSLIKLADREKPFPINLELDESCPISGEFQGILNKPLRNQHFVGKGSVKTVMATSLANLFGYNWDFDLPLKLSGQVDVTYDKILVNDYTLQMDGVHFGGSATYFPEKSPRADLLVKNGEIDLKKFIQAKTEKENTGRIADKKPKAQRIIPVVLLNSEMIAPLSVAVQFDNFKVMYGKAPVTSFNAGLSIINNVLKISPYQSVSYGGSTSQAILIMDFSTLPATATFELTTNDMDYGRILKSLDISNKVVGKMSLKANLKGYGSNLRELFENANGNLEIVADKGKMPKRILELWGGSLVRLLIPTIWFEKDETDLNCGVYRFDINDGFMKSNLMLVDTKRVTVAGEVALDFKTEEIAGLFKPENKEAVLLKLGTPIKLSGTLANIKAEPAESGVATLGKLIFGMYHPSNIILLFGDLDETDKNPCKALLYQNNPEE